MDTLPSSHEPLSPQMGPMPPPPNTKILIVLGTRPEAIKLAPVILDVQNRPGADARVCLTGQHREMVLTDSGGIQEEAAALGKPVLVMRDVTERRESVDAGVSRLVGTRRSVIREWTLRLLRDDATYRQMARKVDVYGDGQASERISAALGLAGGGADRRRLE